MATTREKFRARRACRKYEGTQWKPNILRSLKAQNAKPMVFNVIPIAVLQDKWLGDRPFGGFENYVAINGQPLKIMASRL